MTELSDQPFGKVEDVVSKGDEVTAKVIKLDPEHKKIALSIKEYMIDQNQFNRDDIVMTSGRRNKKKDKDKDEEKEDIHPNAISVRITKKTTTNKGILNSE